MSVHAKTFAKAAPTSNRFTAVEDDIYTQVDYGEGEESGEVLQILQAATVDDFRNLKPTVAAATTGTTATTGTAAAASSAAPLPEKKNQDKSVCHEKEETRKQQHLARQVVEKKRKNDDEEDDHNEEENEEEEEEDEDEEEEETKEKRQKKKDRAAQCLKCEQWFKNGRSLYSHNHKRSKTCIEIEKKRLAQERESMQNKQKTSNVEKEKSVVLPVKKRRQDGDSISDRRFDRDLQAKDDDVAADVPSGADVPVAHEQTLSDVDALIEQTFHINKELERLRLLREQCLANLFRASQAGTLQK